MSSRELPKATIQLITGNDPSLHKYTSISDALHKNLSFIASLIDPTLLTADLPDDLDQVLTIETQSKPEKKAKSAQAVSKPICMATWRYKKPDLNGHRGLKALLKYVTFREDAHHIVPENGAERWIDGGLGRTWREVFANSHALAGEYILANHFVISPDPDLLTLLPQEHRRAALQELTIQTMADWYQARDYAMPETSFVIHNRETTDAENSGRQMLHTHIFCAGSIPTLEGRECPMVKERDVVRNKGGLDRETNLNRIAEQNLAAILDREIGLDWRVGRDLEGHLSLEKERVTPDFAIGSSLDSMPEANWSVPKIDRNLLVPASVPEPEPEPDQDPPDLPFEISFF